MFIPDPEFSLTQSQDPAIKEEVTYIFLDLFNFLPAPRKAQL